MLVFVCSSRRRHTRVQGDWSSDVCSSDLVLAGQRVAPQGIAAGQIAQRQRVAPRARPQPKMTFEIDRPHIIRVRGRGERSEERRVGKEWERTRPAQRGGGTNSVLWMQPAA